jgi:hypothetical protein
VKESFGFYDQRTWHNEKQGFVKNSTRVAVEEFGMEKHSLDI